MPREDIAFFIDLETTGSDVEHDEIIEVGISAIDLQDEDYPEVKSFSRIILPSDEAFLRLMNKRVVREMHQHNGLLEEILERRDSRVEEGVDSSRYVDKELLDFSFSFGGDDSHFHYGGSGVMHFDRPFINKYLPRFSTRLAYYAAFDIGPTRRQFTKAGVGWLPDAMDSKTHRALDDARVHADEFRWSQRYIRGES